MIINDVAATATVVGDAKNGNFLTSPVFCFLPLQQRLSRKIFYRGLPI